MLMQRKKNINRQEYYFYSLKNKIIIITLKQNNYL